MSTSDNYRMLDHVDDDAFILDYAFRLGLRARSRSFRRRQGKIQAGLRERQDGDSWTYTISLILLVEMQERGALHRGGEWLVTAACVRGTSRTRLTLGPLQMTGAPWDLGEAAIAAVEYLESRGCDPVREGKRSSLEEIARAWHGAASRQRGQAISYADALITASLALNRDETIGS